MVRTNQDHVMSNQRITDDLEVTVPRGVAVESRGGSGDHEVGDVEGDVEIAISRGDVRLSKVGGNVRMDVSRSDLVRAADVKGRIDLQGRGSDVELENIAGTGDDQRQLQRLAEFQESGEAAAVRRHARHGIERAGGAGTDQHGSGRIQRERT